MTTEQLQCFFKVAESGSFTVAADGLYMTRPSLSKKIAALEHELGVTLFCRDKSRQTQLTEAGRILYEGFKKVEQETERYIQQARQVEQGQRGSLRMGIFESQIVDEHLREILDGFAQKYPQVELYVTTDSFNGLITGVQEQLYDCVVTIGYDVMGRSGVSHETLYDLEAYLVVPKVFLSLAEPEEYSLLDFKDFPFLTICPENNTFQDKMIREATRRAGFEPKFSYTSDEKNFMLMLELGKGVAVLDAYSKCCNSPHVCCFSLPEFPPSPFDLVWVEKNSNPVFLHFLEYVQKEWKKQI